MQCVQQVPSTDLQNEYVEFEMLGVLRHHRPVQSQSPAGKAQGGQGEGPWVLREWTLGSWAHLSVVFAQALCPFSQIHCNYEK